MIGNHLLICCPCEQLQLAALHLIVSYCAARPGEVVLTRLATDAVMVDIQGLVQMGKESKNRIMLYGLCRVKVIAGPSFALSAAKVLLWSRW